MPLSQRSMMPPDADHAAVPSPAEVVAALDRAATRVETTSDGGRTVWRSWGNGPALVLLHGGHGSWTHWLRVIPGLAADLRVIVPDMPGYGASDPPAEPVTLDGFAATLSRGLDEVLRPNTPATLAGFSFGGVVAGVIAAAAPHRVTRLVLVGAGGLGLQRPPVPTLVKWQEAASDADRAAAHRANLAAVMIADPAKIDALALHIQAENTRRARFRSRSLSLTDALRRALDAAPGLPLAGLWGGKDAMSGPFVDQRRELLRRYDPRAPFVVVPDAGHWLPYEAPAATETALRSFLAADA